MHVTKFRQKMTRKTFCWYDMRPIILCREHHPARARRWPGVGSMLGQCRRRWPNIKPTPGQRTVLAAGTTIPLASDWLIIRRYWGEYRELVLPGGLTQKLLINYDGTCRIRCLESQQAVTDYCSSKPVTAFWLCGAVILSYKLLHDNRCH